MIFSFYCVFGSFSKAQTYELKIYSGMLAHLSIGSFACQSAFQDPPHNLTKPCHAKSVFDNPDVAAEHEKFIVPILQTYNVVREEIRICFRLKFFLQKKILIFLICKNPYKQLYCMG